MGSGIAQQPGPFPVGARVKLSIHGSRRYPELKRKEGRVVENTDIDEQDLIMVIFSGSTMGWLMYPHELELR